MRKILTDEEFRRMANEYNKVKYKCKCGHMVIIPKWVDKQLCGWCGCYEKKKKKDEFEYRMEEQIKRREKDETKV